MYIGGGRGKVHNACMGCRHLSRTACSSSMTAEFPLLFHSLLFLPTLCEAHGYPWVPGGKVSSQPPAPVCTAARQLYLTLQINKQHLWAFHWGFKRPQGAGRWMGLDVLEILVEFLSGLSLSSGMTKMNPRIRRCTFWQWAPTKKEMFEKDLLETFPSPLFLCQTFLKAL